MLLTLSHITCPCSLSTLLPPQLTTYLDSASSTMREEEISNSSRTRRSACFNALQFCCSSLVVKLEPLVGSSAPVVKSMHNCFFSE